MTEQDKKEIAQSFIRGLGNRDANLLRSIMTEASSGACLSKARYPAKQKAWRPSSNARARFTASTSKSK